MTIYNNIELKASYSIDLNQADSEVLQLSTDISLIIVELLFPNDPNGSGTVYTSIDSLKKIRDAILDEDDSSIHWTEWEFREQ